MDRRDFFDPRPLTSGWHALAPSQLAIPGVSAGAKGQGLSPSSHEIPLLRFGRRAMATDFEIAISLGTPNAHPAAEEALDLVNQLESQLTVYRDDSEISRFNRHAAFGPMPVEPRLFALLQQAARIHGDTNGAYDIAVGALIKAWALYRKQGQVPRGSHAFAALQDTGKSNEPEKCRESMAPLLSRCGMNHIVLDSERRTIRFLQRGLEINLGSIGKGYALDRAAELLRTRWNIHNSLLHGGSSSVLAVGTPPQQPRGWPIGLGHPSDMKRRLGVAWLRDRALGTSSATFQHVTHEGQRLGHILDPRTGWPAEKLASATALAPTAAEADALATAFFVLGIQGTRVYCQHHPEVGAVLLAHGQTAPMKFGNVDFV